MLMIALLISPLQSDFSREKVFTDIYQQGVWGHHPDGSGSSGGGSSLEATKTYRTFLQKFLSDHNIKSVVDVGCGDWQFSRTINWGNTHYLGYDVVLPIIEKNRSKYSAPNIHFLHGDAINTDLPGADLLICKDVLQHLSNEDILQFIQQLPKFKYCLITNDIDPLTRSSNNSSIPSGGSRRIDLTQPPFSLQGAKVLTYSCGGDTKQVLLITQP